jgi:hypothetical protein
MLLALTHLPWVLYVAYKSMRSGKNKELLLGGKYH